MNNKDAALQRLIYGKSLLTKSDSVLVNCGEQSSVLYYLLTKTFKAQFADSIFIDYVNLEASEKTPLFDHALLVIRDLSHKEKEYGKAFETSDENDFVIDSWANICCSARDYAKRWDEKMTKWQTRGLVINGKTRPDELKGYIENCQINRLKSGIPETNDKISALS